MAFTPDLAADFLAACQAGAAEASAAFSRALDQEIAVVVGEAATGAEIPLEGPGLLLVMKLGGEAAVVAIAEASGLLPAWYTAPDATGTSKLHTLALELGVSLLPETHMPEEFDVYHVADLATALRRGGLAPTAGAIALELTAGEHSGAAWLAWPISKPAALADRQPVAEEDDETDHESMHYAPAAVGADDLDQALPALPNYTRSLLKIRVPIVVTLAKSQQPLSRIVELAPGSIIPFDKSCDDTLSLEVNNREVAVGEAVKVGDKFGLRITSMILPPERFVPLRK